MLLVASLTIGASLLSAFLAVGMALQQRPNRPDPAGPITVTRKGTSQSVTLPAHYDPAAVQAFLELTK